MENITVSLIYSSQLMDLKSQSQLNNLIQNTGSIIIEQYASSPDYAACGNCAYFSPETPFNQCAINPFHCQNQFTEGCLYWNASPYNKYVIEPTLPKNYIKVVCEVPEPNTEDFIFAAYEIAAIIGVENPLGIHPYLYRSFYRLIPIKQGFRFEFWRYGKYFWHFGVYATHAEAKTAAQKAIEQGVEGKYPDCQRVYLDYYYQGNVDEIYRGWLISFSHNFGAEGDILLIDGETNYQHLLNCSTYLLQSEKRDLAADWIDEYELNRTIPPGQLSLLDLLK